MTEDVYEEINGSCEKRLFSLKLVLNDSECTLNIYTALPIQQFLHFDKLTIMHTSKAC